MHPLAHLRLLLGMTAIWAAFWLLGWPDYYQGWAPAPLVVGWLLLVPVTAWAGWWTLRRARPERRQSLALWLCVYGTVPFALYDSLYCGLHLGLGPGFVVRYWYLSSFYVLPWLMFLPMPRLLKRSEVSRAGE